MLVIKSISFRNFRSYGKVATNINFNVPGTTLIIGKNDDDKTTNGQGKTSILFCLTWLFYDKVLDSLTKDELINNINKQDLHGAVDFSIGDVVYHIERWRKGGKGFRENGVSISENGIDITPASADHTNTLIEKIVGIDFDLFSRIVVFSATNKSFFDLPTNSHYESNQTDMIEQLFDLQSLSIKAQVLKSQIKVTEQSLLTQQTIIEATAKQIATHHDLITKAKTRSVSWENQSKLAINQLTTDLDSIKGVDFEYEKKLHATVNELQKVKSEVKRGVDKVTSTISDLIRESKKLKKEAAALGEAKCPYCEQDFQGSKEKQADVAEKLVQLESDILSCDAESVDMKTKLETVMRLLEAAQAKSTVDDFNHLVELHTQHQQLQTRLEGLRSQLNPHLDTLQELLEAQPEEANFESINTLSQLNEHQAFLLKLLTKKDSFVRKALLLKNIPFLNERMATYLEALGLPHSVEFTPNLNANITQFGRELSYGCLSNGQKARVNFALSLAFCDVLQKIHRKINIQIFDEVLDIGLDSHGISAASRLLKRKAREENLAVFVISHRDEISNAFDNTLIVRQTDGFSHIEITQ
jgi:DNA repair exonuclease SbcCD ATPase subunit